MAAGRQPARLGHAADGLIYVLMHQGGEWTHKQAGSEIWVFNARDGKRTERLSLPEAASAVFVTPDSTPLIFAATPATSCRWEHRRGRSRYCRRKTVDTWARSTSSVVFRPTCSAFNGRCLIQEMENGRPGRTTGA